MLRFKYFIFITLTYVGGVKVLLLTSTYSQRCYIAWSTVLSVICIYNMCKRYTER